MQANKHTMEPINVLMMFPSSYLEDALSPHYNLFRFWECPNREQFLAEHGPSIRAALVTSSVGADAELIDSLPRLEIITSFSVGLDKVDLLKCEQRGIRVTNTPDVLTDDVADLALVLMMSVLRRVPQLDRFVKSGGWVNMNKDKIHTKFTGKRVGIIGLGRIGAAIAQRVEGFNCPISYYSRTRKLDSNYVYYPSVVHLASNCDILVTVCPLSDETHHIVNREVIDALGPKGVLVNVGRGPLVDEGELVAALVEGRLGGAGLDVFEDEPRVPKELFGLDNVVVTPHVGSSTAETRIDMVDLVAANLKAHFDGNPLVTPVL